MEPEIYYLYMLEDVWSRKIVGWQIHEKESPELAASLFKETCVYLKLDPPASCFIRTTVVP